LTYNAAGFFATAGKQRRTARFEDQSVVIPGCQNQVSAIHNLGIWIAGAPQQTSGRQEFTLPACDGASA
jgi:hypothetical protein